MLPTATATELGRAYRDRTAHPVETTRALIERIGGLDGQINAVLIVSPTALVDAADSARRLSDGHPRSALEGVPVLIKDNVDTVDLPTTAGSRLLLDSRPAADAPLVRRLREAGAVVLGKTNLSEWSNFRSTGSISGWSGVGGQTRNPHVLDRNPSGSSAGSAAAVAAGFAPLAIGTETDGSILSPGAHCGVVGFKPTVGLVSGAGIVPITRAQDTAGPMTRSVADAALLLGVLAGRVLDPEAPAAHPEIAFWRPTPVADAEPQAGGGLVLDHFDRCLALLADAGIELIEVPAPPEEEISDAEFPAMISEMARDLTAYLAGRPGAPQGLAALIAGDEADPIELSLFGHERFDQALAAPPADSAGPRDARRRAGELAGRWLQSALADGRRAAVLSPTCGVARPIGHSNELGAFSTYSTAAVAGTPSVTVPVGTIGASGVLPVGLALSGGRGQDARLLGLAALVEATVGRLVTPRLLPTLDGD